MDLGSDAGKVFLGGVGKGDMEENHSTEGDARMGDDSSDGGTVGPNGKGAEQGIENGREYPERTAPEYLTGKIGRDKSKLEMMRHGL